MKLPGQALAVARIGELADGQLIDDQAGGERPVTGPGRLPHRVGEHPFRTYHRAARWYSTGTRSGYS